MSAQSNAAPIIIKRKKVTGGDAHHGGAWKVAYADFVTAMMAFFLLMWLLNATTEKQRKGLADYFSPTIPISRVSGGGDGDFGGESVFAEDTLPKNGTGGTKQRATESNRSRGESGLAQEGEAAMDTLRQTIEEALSGLSGESMVESDLKRHIITRLTDEGLVVELFEIEGARLFDPETDAPSRLLERLLAVVSELAGLVENDVAIEAHTAAVPLTLKVNPVWDMSTTRAASARRILTAAGLASGRVNRVTGHADREPVVENPMALRNNRIELIFLRADQM